MARKRATSKRTAGQRATKPCGAGGSPAFTVRGTTCSGLPAFVQEHYEVHEWKHASAILQTDFPGEWAEIIDVLTNIRVQRSHVLVGGGGRSKITRSIDGALYSRGWVEKKWATRIVVDDVATDSPTHKVDCYKNRVAVEIEWSNKDPFFDRDSHQT